MTYQLERALPLRERTNDLAFSLDGALLAIATRDKKASTLIYQLRDWSLRPAPRFVRRALAFDAGGALIVAGASVERYALTAPKIGRTALSIPGHNKGLTSVAVSPDGRWLAVDKYLDAMELWFVGGASPERRHVGRPIGHGSFVFRADSTAFWFTTHDVVAGSPVSTLHRIALDARGAAGAPTTAPLPEGLSFHDTVSPTVHGLVAITLRAPDVVIYDWDSLRPRPLGVRALQEMASLHHFEVSPDGAFLVAQGRPIEGESHGDWRLVVLSLPGGEEVATIPVGRVAAGRIALSPGAERVAHAWSDINPEVRVFKRLPGAVPSEDPSNRFAE